MPAILAKKIGMTQRFLEDGRVERVTVLEAGPVPRDRDPHPRARRLRGRAARVRRRAREGADAAGARPPQEGRRPARAHARGVPRRGRRATLGDTVTVEAFEVGQTVKVAGVSKGKGFQGTIKRHNFSAGPKSHGSHNVRAPGSIGASATPSRVFKGIRGPGHMGAKRVTQRGLTVVELIPDQNLMLLRGSVPGPKGATVEVRTDG